MSKKHGKIVFCLQMNLSLSSHSKNDVKMQELKESKL